MRTHPLRTGVHDGDFAGLPVGDIDQELRAAAHVEDLLGLAEIQDALRARHGRRTSGDRDLAPRPARHFRQSLPEVAGEPPRPGRREFRGEHEREQGDERRRAEDE